MIRSNFSRSRKGEFTLTLSGLNIQHVRILNSIFRNFKRHRCSEVSNTLYNGLPLAHESFETLLPLDVIRVSGSATRLAVTQHLALLDILSAFPESFTHDIPAREYFYDFKTLQKL